MGGLVEWFKGSGVVLFYFCSVTTSLSAAYSVYLYVAGELQKSIAVSLQAIIGVLVLMMMGQMQDARARSMLDEASRTNRKSAANNAEAMHNLELANEVFERAKAIRAGRPE